MTLTIIFAVLLVVGIVLLVYGDSVRGETWKLIVGFLLTFVTTISLIMNLICWIPSGKDSEIQYDQWMQEKASIESMLITDKNVDRIQLNQMVIDYNNDIIAVQQNSKRFILGEYYSNDIDWDSLQLIDWR